MIEQHYGQKVFYSSLARIADFRRVPFGTIDVPREDWANGDYVLGQVTLARGALARIELTSGRMTEVVRDDVVLGALGVRSATLEAVGSWEDVAPDRRMHLLTSAGLLGRVTSVSHMMSRLVSISYRGHVARAGKKLCMDDFAMPARDDCEYAVPTILLIGTSMSAGKTTAAKVLIRQLKLMGFRVVGAKLSGAGRYRDILGMRDAGADRIFDFVDVGLPSSILAPAAYRPRLRALLSAIAAEEPDVVVAEAGASPLEPYNGESVLAEIGHEVRMTILCASDPYAVVGVMQGFDRRPDLVCGVATSTSAGISLAERLTGIPAINVLDNASMPALRHLTRRLLARRTLRQDGRTGAPT